MNRKIICNYFDSCVSNLLGKHKNHSIHSLVKTSYMGQFYVFLCHMLDSISELQTKNT